MSAKSSSGAMFEKVLGAFDTGGFSYADVITQLRRLLAGGASPAELAEILRRREMVEALPDHAHEGIINLLNEALARAARNADSETPLGPSTDSGAALRRPRLAVPPVDRSARDIASTPNAQAAVFDKVLGAFETGGFTSTDVLAHLKRLLGNGASPTELLEILRRHELVEPLPDYAHTEALELLSATAPVTAVATPKSAPAAPATSALPSLSAALVSAKEQIARQSAEYQTLSHSYERAMEAGTAASARANSLAAELNAARAELESAQARIQVLDAHTRSATQAESELQDARERASALSAELAAANSALESARSKAREIDEAWAEKIAAIEAARSRSTEALRDTEQRHQTESRTLRDSLAARDAALVEARQSLSERDTAANQVQRSLTARDAAVSQAQRALAEREAELTALRQTHAADLATARAALETEQARSREFVESSAEKIESSHREAARRAEALLESEQRRHQAESRALQESLAARDALIGEVRRSLDDRDAQLAERDAQLSERDAKLAERGAQLLAFQQEQAKIAPALDARAKNTALLESDLKEALARATALAGEVTATQAALDSEQRKNREAEKSLAARDAVLVQVKQLLAEREAQLTAQQAESAKIIPTLVPRAKAPLAAVPDASDYRATDQRAEGYGNRDENSGSRTSGFGGRAEGAGARGAGSGGGAAGRAWTPAAPPKPVVAETSSLARSPFGPHGAGNAAPRKPGALGRAKALGVVMVVLALIIWFFGHHSPPSPAAPAAIVPAALPHAGTVIQDCPTCGEMVVLPVGRFKQGSASDQGAASSFEKPLHWVAISHPFAMARNVITVDQFAEFIAATGRDMQGCDTYDGEWKHRAKNGWSDPGFIQTGAHPIVCVSWDDAVAYAQWLSTKTGHRYRLPSASEWEYAARTGAGAVQPWSPDGSDACANANVADQSAALRYPGWSVFACNDGFVFTAPVGSFKANSLGLNDMLGNVFQWTEDCWHADYAGAPVDGSARRDGDCSEHELRGGSWFSSPAFVRANYRDHFAADYRTSSVGIRLVRDVTP